MAIGAGVAGTIEVLSPPVCSHFLCFNFFMFGLFMFNSFLIWLHTNWRLEIICSVKPVVKIQCLTFWAIEALNPLFVSLMGRPANFHRQYWVQVLVFTACAHLAVSIVVSSSMYVLAYNANTDRIVATFWLWLTVS